MSDNTDSNTIRMLTYLFSGLFVFLIAAIMLARALVY